MFRNYLAAALRNLVRNRLYAAINIIGLTVGFAAALLITLYIRDELAFDTWIPNHEQVYLRGATIQLPSGEKVSGPISMPEDAVNLRADFPEVDSAARILSQDRGLRRGDVESSERIMWADPDIFRVLPMPALSGDPATALAAPGTAVLTRRTALKYFGRDDVVGETMELDRARLLRVTAVLHDQPTRSHLNVDIWVSGLTETSPLTAGARGGGNPTTYVRLKPGVARAAVESRLPEWVDRHVSTDQVGLSPGTKASTFMSPWLQPLAEIHASPPEHLPESLVGRPLNPSFRPYGDPALRRALTWVAGLILLVAVGTFVNTMTARAGRRAVEVGVRKVTGAQRRQLVLQFVGESFLYVAVSLVAALAAVSVAMPAFGAFLGRDIAVEPWRDASLPALALGLGVAVTLLGGSYPALVLSRYRPAITLRRELTSAGGANSVRTLLVVVQFAVFVGLILATVVIAHQSQFAQRAGFRVESDQLLVVAAPCSDSLKARLLNLDGVEGAACTGGGAVGSTGGASMSMGHLPDSGEYSITSYSVDAGLLELLGFRPIAGRFLVPGGSRRDVVLNGQAVRRFKMSPQDIIGRAPDYDKEATVVGVVEDFSVGSLRGEIPPTLFTNDESYDHIALKLDGASIGATMPQIETILASLGLPRPPRTFFYDRFLEDAYRDLIRQGQAFGAFATIAVLLAALGLFGLAAFTAEQRTKEIGIRKSMGAKSTDILRLLLWQFAKPVLWANLIAWPVAYFVMQRWLEGFASHIDLSLWMFIAASALALVIAIATVLGHALIVARAQPVTALRYE